MKNINDISTMWDSGLGLRAAGAAAKAREESEIGEISHALISCTSDGLDWQDLGVDLVAFKARRRRFEAESKAFEAETRHMRDPLPENGWVFRDGTWKFTGLEHWAK